MCIAAAYSVRKWPTGTVRCSALNVTCSGCRPRFTQITGLSGLSVVSLRRSTMMFSTCVRSGISNAFALMSSFQNVPDGSKPEPRPVRAGV
jgi:hypothetical protein